MTDQPGFIIEKAAAFLGSFLLFSLELIAARLLLPRFGGSAYVWTTSMMVFQGLLLAAYCYARWGLRRPRVHLGLIALGFLFLPIRIHGSAPLGEPILALIGTLARVAAVPFFVLAATVPVLQAWQGGSYALFAASNAGALAALLSYPFLVEPFLTLGLQLKIWTALYILYAGMNFFCLPDRTEEPSEIERTRWDVAAQWAALSAGPCAATLAATNFISFHFAAVPVFWAVPLAIYLATYILNFKAKPWVPGILFWPLSLLALLACAFGLMALGRHQELVLVLSALGLNLAMLFSAGMLCHRRLALLAPEPARAPVFYAAIALGGWLGSLLIGVAVPCLGRYGANLGIDWAIAFLLCAVGWGLGESVLVRRNAWAFAVSVILGGALVLGARAKDTSTVEAWRDFYGVCRVEEKGGLRRFIHGNTVHGLEYSDPSRAVVPLAYYHEKTPIAALFKSHGAEFQRIAVVGLGVGVLASYGRTGQEIDFFELDPAVAEMARRRFGFLNRSRAKVRVITGDARLSLEASKDAYDLIILDAFASDSVPVHLLTREALEIYLKRLNPGGLILCNLSNRILDLSPVLSSLASALGLSGLINDYDRGSLGKEFFSCRWAALSRENAWAKSLARDGWSALSGGGALWTDQRSSLLPLLRLE